MAKVVLVTGASGGIGLSTARALASDGWSVVGASRRGTCAEGVSALVMDVDVDASVRDGVASVLAQHGRLDAVVACAGWGLAGPVEQTPVQDAKAQFETNFWGAVRVVQAALAPMRAQGSGRVVLMSSVGGVVGLPFQAFYSASKFAIEGLGEALAYEVGPFGIHVSMVEPGNVRTGFTESRRFSPAADGPGSASGTAAYPAAAKAVSVMERDEKAGASPEQVAKAVTKLLDAKRPPRRVSVGKVSERAGILGKRVLPFRVFEAAAKGSLGV